MLFLSSEGRKLFLLLSNGSWMELTKAGRNFKPSQTADKRLCPQVPDFSGHPFKNRSTQISSL